MGKWLLIAMAALTGPNYRAVAQPAGELSSLGSVEQNRRLLEEIAADNSMFISPRSAYVIVERAARATSVRVRYRGGERALWFNGNRAQFRILIQARRPFTIVGISSNRKCFERTYQLRQEGVWRLRLPC